MAVFLLRRGTNGRRIGKPAPMVSTDFGKLLANEIEKSGKVIRKAGIKAE